jgi:hypothetical protein
MSSRVTEPTERDAVAEVRLWQAVILSTIREWISGPLRRKREAERYLFGDGTDFAYVCEAAGMNVGYLRGRLGRLNASPAKSRNLAPSSAVS